MNRLVGKVAIVTGGASGIGRQIVKTFIDQGAKVFISDLNQNALDQVIDEVGKDNASGIVADVADEHDVQKMVSECIACFGKFDVAVNNAGFGGFAPITDYNVEDFRKLIDVCLTGVFICTKHLAKNMVDAGHGGSIINIASLNAFQATEGYSAYCSAKAGVSMLTKVSALELGREGIRVNAIGPGLIRTPATEVLDDFPGLVDAFVKEAPMGRAGTPLDVAHLALYLASDESSFMSGQTLYIDGGASLNKYPPLFDFVDKSWRP